MDYIDSIQLTLSRYFNVNDRATRKEFWFYYLFYILGTVASVFIDLFAGSYVSYRVADSFFGTINIGVFCGIFVLLTTIPFITVGVRRLCDAGFPRLYIFIILMPLFGQIVLYILWAMKTNNNKKVAD